MTNGSRWRVTWEEDEEYAEYLVQSCASIFFMRNPYQYETTSEPHQEAWEFRSRLIGASKHPEWPIEDHEYFITIECHLINWDYKQKGSVSHQLIYGHEWRDLNGLMEDNGFSLNSISSWNHNSKTDDNGNIVVEPKLEITFVQRNKHRKEVI